MKRFRILIHLSSSLYVLSKSSAFTINLLSPTRNTVPGHLSKASLKNFINRQETIDSTQTFAIKEDVESPTNDRTYDNMGMLTPLAEKLDEATGSWALSYADLSPATPQTPAGISFLLTNLGYAVGGISIISQGDLFYGSLVEIAGIVSFWYHFSQLEFGQNRSEVRLALLTDYFTAGAALITGGVYMLQLGLATIPVDTFFVAGASLVALGLCWVWEFGYPYLVLHSIWHILSSYSGYLIGQAHIDAML